MGKSKSSDLVFGLQGSSQSAELTIHETNGYGGRVWASALLLSQYLLDMPSLAKGKRVLELGAGCGATGLTAAACGAAEVVLTDGMEDVLANLSVNVEMNRGSLPAKASVCTQMLNWADDESTDQFDLLLGADIVYIPSSLPYLASTIRRHLKKDGRFLGISPAGRNCFLVFWHYLQCEGLSVRTEEVCDYGKVLKLAAESKRNASKKVSERRRNKKKQQGEGTGDTNVFDLFAGFTYVSEESEDEADDHSAKLAAAAKNADKEVEFVLFEVTFADTAPVGGLEVGGTAAGSPGWCNSALALPLALILTLALATAARCSRATAPQC
jgi:predicted nicotinamide N-methyase